VILPPGTKTVGYLDGDFGTTVAVIVGSEGAVVTPGKVVDDGQASPGPPVMRAVSARVKRSNAWGRNSGSKPRPWSRTRI
jgi:hypothetical protein